MFKKDAFVYVIEVRGRRMRCGQIGEECREDQNLIMDWIEDSIMSVREELGQ